MPLTSGTSIGPYEITAPIGVGGMGEVYRARDTRLYRVVAIKVSHERFSERLEREARAVAGLNHPNICQLYDVGPDYLVLEYVEGGLVGPTENRGSCWKAPCKSPTASRRPMQPGSSIET